MSFQLSNAKIYFQKYLGKTGFAYKSICKMHEEFKCLNTSFIMKINTSQGWGDAKLNLDYGQSKSEQDNKKSELI